MPSRPADAYDEAIGTFLRAELAAQHITYADFGARLGMTEGTIRRYLRGERPMNAGDFIAALDHLEATPGRAITEIRRLAKQA